MGDSLKWCAEQEELATERREWERSHPREARREKIVDLGQRIALKKEELSKVQGELKRLEAELDRVIDQNI